MKTCYLHWYGCWSSDDTHYTGICTLAVLVRWRQLTCTYALVWLQEQRWFTLHWHVYSSGISQVKACYLHVHWYGYWSSTSREDTHYTGTCTLAVLMRWRCTTCVGIVMDTGVVITHTHYTGMCTLAILMRWRAAQQEHSVYMQHGYHGNTHYGTKKINSAAVGRHLSLDSITSSLGHPVTGWQVIINCWQVISSCVLWCHPYLVTGNHQLYSVMSPLPVGRWSPAVLCNVTLTCW